MSTWNAELELAGSPQAILPFSAGLRRSSNPAIFISPASFLLTMKTVGSANAGEKYPVLFLAASIIFASSGDTYFSKSSFWESSIVWSAAQRISPWGLSFSDATRFTRGPVPATMTLTLIPVSFSKAGMTRLFKLSLRAV